MWCGGEVFCGDLLVLSTFTDTVHSPVMRASAGTVHLQVCIPLPTRRRQPAAVVRLCWCQHRPTRRAAFSLRVGGAFTPIFIFTLVTPTSPAIEHEAAD